MLSLFLNKIQLNGTTVCRTNLENSEAPKSTGGTDDITRHITHRKTVLGKFAFKILRNWIEALLGA